MDKYLGKESVEKFIQLTKSNINSNLSNHFTVNVQASNWLNNQQTIKNANIIADDNFSYIIGLSTNNIADYAGSSIWADDIDVNGQMTIHSKSEQENDLTLQIVRIRTKDDNFFAGRKVISKILGVSSVLPPIGKTLEEYSWKEISKISKGGKAKEYGFKEGDIKSITFNGNTDYVQIIGFNHDNVDNVGKYGRGKAGITFQYGVSNDKERKGLLPEKYALESGNSGYTKGWKDCNFRNIIVPRIKGYMPEDLQKVIVPVNKSSAAGCYDKTIDVTTDELFLLSEFEIFGNVTYSPVAEGNWYTFYSNGGSAMRYLDDSYWTWITRSPRYEYSGEICAVNTAGRASTYSCWAATGTTFCFCV